MAEQADLNHVYSIMPQGAVSALSPYISKAKTSKIVTLFVVKLEHIDTIFIRL